MVPSSLLFVGVPHSGRRLVHGLATRLIWCCVFHVSEPREQLNGLDPGENIPLCRLGSIVGRPSAVLDAYPPVDQEVIPVLIKIG